MSILSSVAIGWLGRRLGDWGGWIVTVGGAVATLYGALDPVTQHAVLEAGKQLVTGHWRDIPLGQIVTALGAISLVWSQRASFKATTTPQVVTDEGKRVETDKLAPAAQQTINATVKAAPKTILDALIDKLNRNR